MKHSKNQNWETFCCEYCGAENGQPHKSGCPCTTCPFCKQSLKNPYQNCDYVLDNWLSFLEIDPQGFDEKTGLIQFDGHAKSIGTDPFTCIECGKQSYKGIYYITKEAIPLLNPFKAQTKDGNEIRRRFRKNVLCEKCCLLQKG